MAKPSERIFIQGVNDLFSVRSAIRLKGEEYMNKQLTDVQKSEIKEGNNLTSATLTVFKKYHLENKEAECLIMDRVLM